MSDTLVNVEGLYKKFTKNLRKSLLYGTADMAKSMFGFKVQQDRLRKGEFWALQDINFELKRGEAFGIIGQNGCGKTTLLRMLTGIFPPDKGRITINGRIGALIAVGAGFHPHMSGRENIYLNGTILGMTKNDIKQNFDNIIDFAEIGDFLDSPVATYSSGMTVRLGFAIAIHSHPDIVLIDEILAVGDAKFQRKCLDKIQEMRTDTGVSFLIVSHNMQNIEAMCRNSIFIDKGKQIASGATKSIIPLYETMLQSGKFLLDKMKQEQTRPNTEEELALIFKYENFGTDEIVVNSVKIQNVNSPFSKIIHSEEPFTVSVNVESRKDLENIYIWLAFFYINDRDNEDNNQACLGIRQLVSLKKGLNNLKLNFNNIQLSTGEYKIGLFVFDHSFLNPYSQGYYGYFNVLHFIPTLLKVGESVPYCWSTDKIKINQEV